MQVQYILMHRGVASSVGKRVTCESSNLWDCACPTLMTCTCRCKKKVLQLLIFCDSILHPVIGEFHGVHYYDLENQSPLFDNRKPRLGHVMYPTRKVFHKLCAPHNIEFPEVDMLVLVRHGISLRVQCIVFRETPTIVWERENKKTKKSYSHTSNIKHCCQSGWSKEYGLETKRRQERNKIMQDSLWAFISHTCWTFVSWSNTQSEKASSGIVS